MKKSASKERRASSFQGASALADVVWNGQELGWLLTLPGQESVWQAALGLVDGTWLYPPYDAHDLVGKGIVLLPQRLESYDSPEALLERLQDFVHRYCDVPEFWEQLIAHYAMMSWLYDKFSAVPYLRFLGEPQSGKTRCVLTAAHLCWKTILGGGSTTSSPFFRLLDSWRGTFVIDEADYGQSELWTDIVKILNQGYMHGLSVLRSEKNGLGFEPQGFEVFGPKVFSTRGEFGDLALESRCITLRTPENQILRANVPRALPGAFHTESQTLRNQLLSFRQDHWRSTTPNEDALVGLSPRLCQIAVPLWTVSPSASFRRDLIEFLDSMATEQRTLRPAGLVVEAIRRATVNHPWTELPQCVLSVRDIAASVEAISGDWATETKLSAKACGSLIRALGLETFRGRMGIYEFTVTQAKLKLLQ